jgi:hypothetical protein
MTYGKGNKLVTQGQIPHDSVPMKHSRQTLRQKVEWNLPGWGVSV